MKIQLFFIDYYNKNSSGLSKKKAKVDIIELKNSNYRLLEDPDYSSQVVKTAKIHALEKLNSEVMAVLSG